MYNLYWIDMEASSNSRGWHDKTSIVGSPPIYMYSHKTHAEMHTSYIHTVRQTDRHAYIHTYIHTHTYTYIHTYINIYRQTRHKVTSRFLSLLYHTPILPRQSSCPVRHLAGGSNQLPKETSSVHRLVQFGT